MTKRLVKLSFEKARGQNLDSDKNMKTFVNWLRDNDVKSDDLFFKIYDNEERGVYTRDKISIEGPPFNNECLKADIFDVEAYGLRDMKYPYPLDADRPAIKEFFASPWR